MKERPILFSGSMVRAILSGAKTQTRRVIKPQPWFMPEAYDHGPQWAWAYSWPSCTLQGPPPEHQPLPIHWQMPHSHQPAILASYQSGSTMPADSCVLP